MGPRLLRGEQPVLDLLGDPSVILGELHELSLAEEEEIVNRRGFPGDQCAACAPGVYRCAMPSNYDAAWKVGVAITSSG
jgi:hypothetical protein